MAREVPSKTRPRHSRRDAGRVLVHAERTAPPRVLPPHKDLAAHCFAPSPASDTVLREASEGAEECVVVVMVSVVVVMGVDCGDSE